MPKASIVIVNYNGKHLTVECLKSLENQDLKDFEIIVVDNNSSDNSLYEIQKFVEKSTIAPCVKVIPLHRNTGFTGGNLEGLRHAKGEYIALLNNDTEADKGWLEELVKAMDSYPEVGICASKMVVYGKDIIDSAGDGYTTSLKGFKRGEGERVERFNQSEYIFGACAGAALYKREVIKETGFFDEDFFLIHEDTDLNFRTQLAGWKVLYVPTAVVYHKVRSSIGHMSDTAIYYTLRNSEFVRIKNIPCGIFLRCLPEFLIGLMTEFMYFAIKHKKLKLYLKAKWDALKMLSMMLKKRKEMMRLKRVSNEYIYRMMTSVWQKDFVKAKFEKFLYG